ncbi:ABC transporter substrate-binding protein [Microlunatus soli]|uniref:Peptide/nickel transport system substrate-binding protein n=1 Tax=Microlunatus soli TaxID=630515 RepID=A0A1H1R200_9ACTN|nr:ABC transporter substrate-binding protein [Microlunatus soli]SDS29555.1 peptide/nickel transport system substrate-binding protein [Microlunatus soli]
MRYSRKLLSLLLAAVVAVAVVACSDPTNPSSGGGGASSQQGNGPSGTINLFMYQKPNGVFGPLASASGPDQQVISLAYDTLMAATPKGELVPAAAASEPKVSDGGKTITFTLRDGLTWSDGKPLTSDDLLFTYTRAADTNAASSQAAYLGGVAGVADYIAGKAKEISGLSAPDEHTFVIKQTEANPALVGQVGMIGILPKHVLEKEPIKDFANNDWFHKPTVTSGPFTFDEYKTDQYVHLTANPKFREPVGVKDVYVKPLTADVATQQLSTGEMDVAWISPNDIDTVKGFQGASVQEVKSTGMVVAGWNQSQKRFADPKVKQAFLYAVDRKGIVKSALAGHGQVRNSVWPEKWSGTDINSYDYDPAKAKQLLKEAKFDFSKPVTLAWIAGGNPDRDAAATVMEQQLNAVGVKLKLKRVQGSYFTDVFTTHKYDMLLYGGGDYGTVPANAGPVTACDQKVPKGPNTGLYCNPELDTAIKAAMLKTDPTEQQAAFEKAAKIENADPALMWLYSLNWVFGVSKRVQNFQPLNNANYYEPWKWTVTS